MLYGKIVSSSINKFKGGKDLGKLSLDGLVKGENILERGECQNDVVGSLWGWGGEDGNTSDDTQSPFRPNEELF